MLDLITAFGQRLPNRWLLTIALPGLLYVALASCAVVARQHHALDIDFLIDQANSTWHSRSRQWPAGPLFAVVAAIGVAILVGLLANLLGAQAVHRLWMAKMPQWWPWRARAQSRWAAKHPSAAKVYQPDHLTTLAEHFRRVGIAADVQYGLSILEIWPRVWLLANPETRTMINAALHRYLSATTLTAWGLLSIIWAGIWWPASVIGLALMLLGFLCAKPAAATLAALMESAVDIHQQDLAAAVGVPLTEGRVTRSEGNMINNIVNKRR